jgi:hypothetical protein
MELLQLPVGKLRLNPHNDRHGPLRDETAAVHWLLENRANHMRALAADLSQSKRLFALPLVRNEQDDFVVFDGNRRTCCIKLLLNPELAPSEAWKIFFQTFERTAMEKAFSIVECEIESDLSIIDEILFRRHTGSQDGVGQSQWDPEGKSNFLQRTGKDSVGLGQTIERILKTENLLPPDTDLPWSNLERLLSSEPIRRRIGVSFSGGSLTYLGNKADNVQTLQRIATDLSRREIVLGDIWNNTAKGRYLDELKSAGFAIDTAPSRLKSEDNSTETKSTRQVRQVRRGRTPKEKNLISHADQNPFMHNADCERAEQIWRELQFHLEFDIHDNAIAVLMRVLLDVAITHYAREQGIVFQRTDSFAKKVASVADSMLNRDFIDPKARSIIRKFESDKPLVSAHSMHQYVHNPSFHPSKSDLKAIWNVVRPLIISSTR